MKKVMKITFVAAFAAVAGYGVYMNQKADTMSDLMLANAEALAGSELSNTSCEAGWEKECCVCGSIHHLFAHVRGGYTGGFCETQKCSHAY